MGVERTQTRAVRVCRNRHARNNKTERARPYLPSFAEIVQGLRVRFNCTNDNEGVCPFVASVGGKLDIGRYCDTMEGKLFAVLQAATGI